VDVGDHPPITPVRAATEDELGGGDTWLIYDYVARHFLASLSGVLVSGVLNVVPIIAGLRVVADAPCHS
jgi:DNA topoisomerase IA